MKVGVTGAAGLHGARLCRVLAAAGHEVVGLDSRVQGSNFPQGENIQLIQSDCRRTDLVQATFQGCQVVFHLAAHLGGHKYINDNSYRIFSDNVSIDMSVFKACAALEVPRVIYPSSSCVYPTDKQQAWDTVLKESDAWDQPNPDCAYGWGKLTGEIMLRNTPIPHGIVLRLFGVYGDGSTSQVIPELMRKAVDAPEGGVVEVQGDGSAGRAFMFIDDVMDAYLKAMTHTLKPGFQVMNLGHTETTTIRELTKAIIQVSGRHVRPRFKASMGTGGQGKTADISRAREVLGWGPQTSLMDGLRMTYELHYGTGREP